MRCRRTQPSSTASRTTPELRADEVELRSDVVGYTRDYVLENGALVMPAERLKFWRDYFSRIPADQKRRVAAELIAWLVKCVRIVGEDQERRQAIRERRSGLEAALDNTAEIVTALLIENGPFLLRGIGNGVIEAEGTSVAIKDGKVIDASSQRKELMSLPVLSAERAIDRMGATAAFNLQQMRETIVQVRQEAASFFRLVLIFATVGFLVIIAGVTTMLFGYVAPGAVTAAAGIVPQALAALFLKKDRELKVTLTEFDTRIRASEHFLTAVSVTDTIDDPNARNLMKSKIVEAMLNDVHRINRASGDTDSQEARSPGNNKGRARTRSPS